MGIRNYCWVSYKRYDTSHQGIYDIYLIMEFYMFRDTFMLTSDLHISYIDSYVIPKIKP